MQHCEKTLIKLAATFLACVTSLAITGDIHAQQSTWSNAAGGSFLDSANWDSGIPSATDNAEFDLNEIYDITLETDHTINSWQQSSGQITVSGGAVLSANMNTIVNEATLNLTGSATEFESAAGFFVAVSGQTASLNLSSAAKLTTIDFSLGNNGSTGIASVSGNGSLMSVSGTTYAGRRGDGILSVNNGGLVITQQTLVGQSNFGSLEVDGPGSEFRNSRRILIAVQDQGEGHVSISNGGLITTNDITVANTLRGLTGTLTIDGVGSRLSTATLQSGKLGAIRVSNGASIDTNSMIMDGTLFISGEGTTVTSNTTLPSLAGEMRIESGARYIQEKEGRFVLEGSGNTAMVTVTGEGSRWDSMGWLNLGANATASMQILDGGVVTNTVTQLGHLGGEGTLVINGENSMLETGAFVVGTGSVSIEKGALLSSEDGFIVPGVGGDSFSEVHVSGEGTLWEVNGNLRIGRATAGDREGDLKITDGAGLHVASGGLNILQTGTLEISNANLTSFNPTISEGNIVLGGLSRLDTDMRLLGPATLEVDDNANATITGFLLHNGSGIEIGQNGELTVQGLAGGDGNFGGPGRVVFESGYTPGNFTGVRTVEVSFENLLLAETSELRIEIGGLAFGEYDRLHVLGDAELGGNLSVSLIDGFELSGGQEFLIVDVDSERSGFFTGLAEGDLIGSFGDVDLFISYSGGSGDDVLLFTTSAVPEPASAAIVMLVLGAFVLRRRK